MIVGWGEGAVIGRGRFEGSLFISRYTRRLRGGGSEHRRENIIMSEYQRGYYAAKMARWPEHRPPFPPHPLFKAAMEAARILRDEADNVCAVLDEGDEFTKKLAPAIDRFDESMIAITNWLRGLEAPPSSRGGG